MLRYHELLRKMNANSNGFTLDLNDPCDRAVVSECLTETETFEILSLHDDIHCMGDEPTQKVELDNV